MKKILISLLFLFAVPVFSCPTISGNYNNCTSGDPFLDSIYDISPTLSIEAVIDGGFQIDGELFLTDIISEFNEIFEDEQVLATINYVVESSCIDEMFSHEITDITSIDFIHKVPPFPGYEGALTNLIRNMMIGEKREYYINDSDELKINFTDTLGEVEITCIKN